QINSDLRLAFKLYAKAGANAPRDSSSRSLGIAAPSRPARKSPPER
ncbi:unnamed protein product, partial [Ascophyllum nodosum]